jgi:hypothetical protein
MSWPRRHYIRARAFDRHPSGIEPAPPQFVAKKFSHLRFIGSRGFDIDQPTRQPKEFHARKEYQSLVARR